VDYNDFIHTVADRVGMPVDQARALTRATLETLAQGLSGRQAKDLANQLPVGLRERLHKHRDNAERVELPEFIRRVSGLADIDTDRARAGVRAVLITLRDAVSAAEFADTMSELPAQYRELDPPVVAPSGALHRRR
jgi:uncharacterized protein (DUF2267 family)